MKLSQYLNKNNIKRYQKLLAQINTLTKRYEERAASEENFSVQEEFLKVKNSTLSDKEKINEAMALCRIAAFSTISQKHYDVQIMGALALIDGKIAQMKTGEGKTLMCSAAVAANFMLGKITHVATANEYLAQRDAQTMTPVYEALGMKVSHNVSGMPHDEKKSAYLAQVMYSTAQEMGFDYLRDNLVKTLEEKIQPQNFKDVCAVIDEADFILIDEARTPLIISGNDRTLEASFYNAIKDIALGLQKMSGEPRKNPMNLSQTITPDGDFWVDERQRAAHLSDAGYHKIEEALLSAGVLEESTNSYENGHLLYNRKNLWLIEEVLNAIKAQHLFIRDKQYVVKNDEIVIIDENTGRLSVGRTWSDGLHQAIEAKEGVKINPLTTTVGTVSIQNYFRLYGKISGMTGTAVNAAEEFEQIYSTQVVEIPTNKRMIRRDAPDVVYMRAQEKYAAIVADIAKRHSNGQPLLLGTTSVQESETISQLLQAENIPHHVLNAKNHALEAQIIAQAGVPGSVTVSTSMAGRGTDIILGGNVEEIKNLKLHQIQNLEEIIDFIDELILNRQEVGETVSYTSELEEQNAVQSKEELERELSGNDIQAAFYLQTYIEKLQDSNYLTQKSLFQLLNEKNMIVDIIDKLGAQIQDTVENWSMSREAALEAGGLCVIGCSRNESRRIDDQLRGRAGRQGDKGESIFYLSFEDQWLRVFGQSSMFKILQKNFDPAQPIQAPMIARSIEKAQKAIEGIHFDNRKNVFQYDSVLDESRRYFFTLRDSIITSPETLRTALAASIRTKMERMNNWEYLQSTHTTYKGESIALDELTEKLYDEKTERAEQIDITVAFLAAILECKTESAQTLFQIVEFNDYWRRFDNAKIKTDASFHKFLSKYVLNYFSHMTPDFWQWFNHFSIDTLDEAWLDYLHITEEIRQNSSLSSLAQKNPLYEYKKACYNLFANIIETFEANWIDSIFNKIVVNVEPGAQLALENNPTSELNAESDIDSEEIINNSLVSTVFEPHPRTYENAVAIANLGHPETTELNALESEDIVDNETREDNKTEVLLLPRTRDTSKPSFISYYAYSPSSITYTQSVNYLPVKSAAITPSQEAPKEIVEQNVLAETIVDSIPENSIATIEEKPRHLTDLPPVMQVAVEETQSANDESLSYVAPIDNIETVASHETETDINNSTHTTIPHSPTTLAMELALKEETQDNSKDTHKATVELQPYSFDTGFEPVDVQWLEPEIITEGEVAEIEKAYLEQVQALAQDENVSIAPIDSETAHDYDNQKEDNTFVYVKPIEFPVDAAANNALFDKEKETITEELK